MMAVSSSPVGVLTIAVRYDIDASRRSFIGTSFASPFKSSGFSHTLNSTLRESSLLSLSSFMPRCTMMAFSSAFFSSLALASGTIHSNDFKSGWPRVIWKPRSPLNSPPSSVLAWSAIPSTWIPSVYSPASMWSNLNRTLYLYKSFFFSSRGARLPYMNVLSPSLISVTHMYSTVSSSFAAPSLFVRFTFRKNSYRPPCAGANMSNSYVFRVTSPSIQFSLNESSPPISFQLSPSSGSSTLRRKTPSALSEG